MSLTDALAAVDRSDWQGACELFAAADTAVELGPAELERWAEAARWANCTSDSIDLLERAQSAWDAAGDQLSSARVALLLSRRHFESGEDAISTGWLRRAERMLAQLDECALHGRLVLTLARGMLGRGHIDEGRKEAERAVEIARRYGDRDLEALATRDIGHATIAAGDVQDGMALLDEAMTIALGAGVSLDATGAVYCSTISACRNIGDWARAGEWTDASQRWCRRHAISGFPGGLCQLHRAELTRQRGELEAAEEEALHSAEVLLMNAPRFAGWAYHELGEVRRRRGDVDAATEAFRRAVELGFDPQPGLALLHLQRGDASAALHAITRALGASSAGARESRPLLLPAAVTIALAAGDRGTAEECANELVRLAETVGTRFIAASAACAEGEVALAVGDHARAIEQFQNAWTTWCEINAPADAARAKVLLAAGYRELGDRTNEIAELEAALATYERLGMAAEHAHVERLLADTTQQRSIDLAFMFTDIVGSTQLLSVLGNDSWEHMLGLHDRILRAQFAANQGDEIKHEGDGFFVAFPTSSAAADCAIAIQRALAAHRKEHGFAPAVRIGFHRGPATHRRGDYVGTGVNIAARIAAKAGAGEIFCSRSSVNRHQPGLGESRMFELKGLSEPVEVVTIRWE